MLSQLTNLGTLPFVYHVGHLWRHLRTLNLWLSRPKPELSWAHLKVHNTGTWFSALVDRPPTAFTTDCLEMTSDDPGSLTRSCPTLGVGIATLFHASHWPAEAANENGQHRDGYFLAGKGTRGLAIMGFTPDQQTSSERPKYGSGAEASRIMLTMWLLKQGYCTESKGLTLAPVLLHQRASECQPLLQWTKQNFFCCLCAEVDSVIGGQPPSMTHSLSLLHMQFISS